MDHIIIKLSSTTHNHICMASIYGITIISLVDHSCNTRVLKRPLTPGSQDDEPNQKVSDMTGGNDNYRSIDDCSSQSQPTLPHCAIGSYPTPTIYSSAQISNWLLAAVPDIVAQILLQILLSVPTSWPMATDRRRY